MAEPVKCECSGRSGGGCFTEIVAALILVWLFCLGGANALKGWTERNANPTPVAAPAEPKE
jgi:hypothetical protein